MDLVLYRSYKIPIIKNSAADITPCETIVKIDPCIPGTFMEKRPKIAMFICAIEE